MWLTAMVVDGLGRGRDGREDKWNYGRVIKCASVFSDYSLNPEIKMQDNLFCSKLI